MINKTNAPNWNWHHSIYCDNDPCTCKDDEWFAQSIGVCQVCGIPTSGSRCYRTDGCKEAGGGEVM